MTVDRLKQISALILNSVQARLLLSFGTVIVTSLALTGTFLFMHLSIVGQYNRITDSFVSENRFAVGIPKLVETYYNNVYSGRPSGEQRAAYDQARQEILDALGYLDATVSDPESLVAYQNLRNFAVNILKQCDLGMARLAQGDTVGAIDIYSQEIAPVRPFVYENTSKLTAAELKSAVVLEQKADAAHQLMLWLTLVLFLLVGTADFFLVRGASESVSRPLQELTGLARKISSGNLGAAPSPEYLARQDEIGSLAVSLSEMLQKLKQELESQRSENVELARIGQELESRNADLAKVNRYMVDRELKMIQLKERITELEGKIAALGKS